MSFAATSPSFTEQLDEAGITALARYWELSVNSARAKLTALCETPSCYENWLARLGPAAQSAVSDLAFGETTWTPDELRARLLAVSHSQVRSLEVEDELRAHCLLYSERHALPQKLILEPGLRAYIIERHLHIPQTTTEELPTLNPTFHPLVPLRLFLAAVAGEGYRVLSDDSFFFKPSARKLTAKFSLPPSPAVLSLLFRFATQLDFLRTRGGHADLWLDTLYHLNFHEATFLYFSHVCLSPLLAFFMALKQGSPQSWYEEKAAETLLAKCLSLPLYFRLIPRTPVWQADHDPLATLGVADLVALGYLVRKTIDGKPHIQINPWYCEWLFDHVPPLKRTRMSDFSQRFMVGPNYEVLMPPDLAWPSFLQLISLARTERCDLVCHLKISKQSIKNGIKLGVEADQITSFFRTHAWSLPTNVAQALSDWTKGNSPRHAPARQVDEGIALEDLRREVNRVLSLPLADSLTRSTKKGRASYTLWQHTPPPVAVTGDRTRALETVLIDSGEVRQRERAAKDVLFFLEECVREKRSCEILHAPREGRQRWRTVLPARIHRDGVTIYIEAQCPDIDIVRSFKLEHILEIKTLK
jgi:hypothetical protein